MEWLGRPLAFTLALVACLVWAVMGPIFHWSDTWQLWINTATTVITFLMLFVLQHSQNSDTAEIKQMLRVILAEPQSSSAPEPMKPFYLGDSE